MFRLFFVSLGKRNVQPLLVTSVEDLVAKDHPYRHLLRIVPFESLCAPLRSKYSKAGRAGYPVETIFKALLLQWLEDLSDRELERFLKENLAGKLFCGFELGDATPDFSTFSVARDRLGTEGVAELFNSVREALKQAGLVREVFTFVDATQLTSKLNLWRERDMLIGQGEKKLGNETVALVAADPQARFGRKGGTKWYGYKFHAAVDMSQGLIVRVAITPANVEDTKAVRHVLPRSGMVFGDKAYGVGESAWWMKRLGLHCGAILKNNMKAKDHDKDRWLCSVRMPFESTFSKIQKRARYRGVKKTQFQAFMDAFAFNCKRLLTIHAEPLVLRPHCA